MTVVLDTELDDEVVGGAGEANRTERPKCGCVLINGKRMMICGKHEGVFLDELERERKEREDRQDPQLAWTMGEEDVRSHGRVMPFPAKLVLGLSPSVSLNEPVDVTVRDDGTVVVVGGGTEYPAIDTLVPIQIVWTELPVEVWDWYYERIMGGKSPEQINPERWHLQYVYDEAQVSVPPRRSTAGRGRRGAYEAPRDTSPSQLPFALVQVNDDVVPVLLGDDGTDSLTAVNAVDGGIVSLGPENIVGLVSAEPAAVWYGVIATQQQQEMRLAAEEIEGGPSNPKLHAKRGDVMQQYPGLVVRKGMPFQVRPRGQRFQWTPVKPQGLTAFPEVKQVLMRQRDSVPTVDTIRMATIFAGFTVHAGTDEAEETFTMLLQRYEAMHGAMPPVEEIQDILARHLPGARARMYESALPWANIVQEALKRGLRDRELRRYLWTEIPAEDMLESIGLAKMSFALMLMGQNLCCLDTWILGAMFAKNPFDESDTQQAAIRRRDTADHISGQWKWHEGVKTRQLGLHRYEQVEDALLKSNPWHQAGPLDRAQTQWTSWEWALGIPAYHRPWSEITREMQAQRVDLQTEVPF